MKIKNIQVRVRNKNTGEKGWIELWEFGSKIFETIKDVENAKNEKGGKK